MPATRKIMGIGRSQVTKIAQTVISADSFKVKVTSDDTTEDYLLSKLVAGSNITLTELNGGGDESIQIDSTGGGGGGTTNWATGADGSLFHANPVAVGGASVSSTAANYPLSIRSASGSYSIYAKSTHSNLIPALVMENDNGTTTQFTVGLNDTAESATRPHDFGFIWASENCSGMRFGTNNRERMLISGANVGIGNFHEYGVGYHALPSALLNVYQRSGTCDVTFETPTAHQTNLWLRANTDSSNNDGNGFKFRVDPENDGRTFHLIDVTGSKNAITISGNSSTTQHNMALGQHSTQSGKGAPIYINSDGHVGAGGYVGIGFLATDDLPAYDLDVQGDTQLSGSLFVKTGSTIATFSGNSIYTSDGKINLGKSTDGDVYFYSGATAYGRIRPSDNEFVVMGQNTVKRSSFLEQAGTGGLIVYSGASTAIWATGASCQIHPTPSTPSGPGSAINLGIFGTFGGKVTPLGGTANVGDFISTISGAVASTITLPTIAEDTLGQTLLVQVSQANPGSPRNVIFARGTVSDYINDVQSDLTVVMDANYLFVIILAESSPAQRYYISAVNPALGI